MIKAVIFDFFGVLVGDGFESTYRSAGGDPKKDKEFIIPLLDKVNRGYITSDEFRQKICAHLGIAVADYQKAMTHAEALNHELLAFVGKLKKDGLKTAILSNVNKNGLDRRIDKSLLDKLFDEVVVSGEVGFVKPERAIYELTAQKLNVDPQECIFIDDREEYVSAASSLGMKAILYEDNKVLEEEVTKLIAAVANN